LRHHECGCVAGNIALIDRGNCTFVIKAGAAQAVGARSRDHRQQRRGPAAESMGGSDPSITIPVVGIAGGRSDDQANLPGVTVDRSIRTSSQPLAGAAMPRTGLSCTPGRASPAVRQSRTTTCGSRRTR
jgi:hypothetical protein